MSRYAQKLQNCWFFQYNHNFVTARPCVEKRRTPIASPAFGQNSRMQKCQILPYELEIVSVWSMHKYLPKALIHEHVGGIVLVRGLWTAFTCQRQQNRLAALSSPNTSTSKTNHVLFFSRTYILVLSLLCTFEFIQPILSFVNNSISFCKNCAPQNYKMQKFWLCSPLTLPSYSLSLLFSKGKFSPSCVIREQIGNFTIRRARVLSINNT